ncbi:hypothetical protein AB7813_02270 [Tardiphaga sp. 20_F10_N6_6]|uniref:hypothetical protein n=1 Tax=Tardiphaga sp. 20_F10_N6_6 TaxID=3240788 RepID=UPI003F8C026B
MASHWHTADGPSEIRHDDDIGYYGGWTISGLAVVATITAVWYLAHCVTEALATTQQRCARTLNDGDEKGPEHMLRAFVNSVSRG